MLEDIRKEINSLDKELIDLISKRIKIGKKVAEAKVDEDVKTFFRPDREQAVLNRIKELNPGELDNVRLQNIFREIMGATIDVQTSMKIGYLGPEGTFSHQAAFKKFGHTIPLVPCSDFHEIFDEVQKGNLRYGIVPIENSIEGVINNTLDHLLKFDLNIYSEVYLAIHNNLLTYANDYSQIKTIYTHPQPYGQCRAWLEKHIPKVDFHETSSTSKGAHIIAEKKDPSIAAIASVAAAEAFNIPVLAKKIEDYERNNTRFIVVSKEKALATPDSRTTIMFAVHHEPGSLFQALKPIHERKLNMTSIESRPYRSEPWNYIFYLDLLGHVNDPEVSGALELIKKSTPFFRVLGSYPLDQDFS